MARSFFTIVNDAELASASASFSSLISASPQSFGLSHAIAAEYAAKQALFADAVAAVANPQTRTTALVYGKNDARKALVKMASELARRIDGTPSVSDEQRAKLGLNIRKPAAPLGPPGTPFGFKLTLCGTGDMQLEWKCNNPRGSVSTTYRVFRQINGVGEFEYVGGAGRRKFLDSTLPTGLSRITYRVQAVRSTAVGPWAEFNIHIGRSSNAGVRATGVQTAPARLAA